jgi:hypothetical protein
LWFPSQQQYKHSDYINTGQHSNRFFLIFIGMESKEYYIKLQVMVDKAKELKGWISDSDDDETIEYLRAALELLYSDMRELIKERDSKK